MFSFGKNRRRYFPASTRKAMVWIAVLRDCAKATLRLPTSSPKPMTNVRRPSQPWTNLGCSPRDLCVTLGNAVRQGRDSFATVGVDRQVVAMLIDRHKVGPFLAHLIASSPPRHIAPGIQDLIAAAATRQTAIANRCLDGFAIVADHFACAGVPVVMLKGPAIGERLFGGAANRGYWDLDILVHEHHRQTAGELLEGLGFRRTSSVLFSERLSALFSHGFDYETCDLKVDLHWCLSRSPAIRIDTSAMMQRAVRFNVGGRETIILAPEDELVFELISMFADIQRGRLRLQAFVDLFAMLRQLLRIEWRGFFDRRGAEGCEGACRGVLGVFLATLAAESEFPALAAALGPLPSFEESLDLLASGSGNGRAKLWAARRMSVSPFRYAAWWVVSLPFRTAASHPLFRGCAPPRTPG